MNFLTVTKSLQRLQFLENVELLHQVSDATSADMEYSEPEVEPERVSITFKAGIGVYRQNAQINVTGQMAEFDYTIVADLETVNAAGLSFWLTIANDTDLIPVNRDRIIIRGAMCSVMKARLVGWNTTGRLAGKFTFLSLYAKRIPR